MRIRYSLSTSVEKCRNTLTCTYLPAAVGTRCEIFSWVSSSMLFSPSRLLFFFLPLARRLGAVGAFGACIIKCARPGSRYTGILWGIRGWNKLSRLDDPYMAVFAFDALRLLQMEQIWEKNSTLLALRGSICFVARMKRQLRLELL